MSKCQYVTYETVRFWGGAGKSRFRENTKRRI